VSAASQQPKAAVVPSGAPLRTARDFYSELIVDSQSGRAGFLHEREKWLRAVKVDGKEELLFCFELLLRGIERYFNLHNLPIDPGAQVVTRDFREELLHVRDAMEEAIRVARQLLDQDADQRMVFRRYIESTLADDRARRALLEEELDQDSPQESLFVLRQSFDALRSIVDHLLRVESCSFGLYTDVGNLLLREIVLNRYFRPFRPLEFRLEYDRVKSVPLLETLQTLEEPARRPFTVAFLGLFRLLHYLGYVEGSKGQAPRAKVILALVRSEAGSLAAWLGGEFPALVPLKRHKAAAIRAANELHRESARITRSVLGAADAGPQATAEAHAAYVALCRGQLRVLLRALDPELAADDFDALTSRAAMGERLRTDLWAFAALCEAASRAVRKGPGPSATTALSAMRSYLRYFHQVGYQLLRYGDLLPFDRFARLLTDTEKVPEADASRQRLADDLHLFGQAAQTLFAHVSRRKALAGTKFDARGARALMARFRAG
jgi:hypothetical protein